MNSLGLLLSFLYIVYASQCSCNSGTLSQSFSTAEQVFAANVLGTSNDGTALVAVTEVFKGSSYSVNDLVYIRYSCGTFPVQAGREGVFFTTAPSNVGGSYVTHLVECTRNSVFTDEERDQLRTGIFLPPQCSDPTTGKIYAEGETFIMGCNTCQCVNGETKCTKKDCQEPTTSDCTTDSGNVIPNGGSIKDDCNVCTCDHGNFLCTEMGCDTPSSSHNSCTYDGEEYADGEYWDTDDGCTRRWMCDNGRANLLEDDCGGSSSNGSSKFFIIGISLASAIVVVIMATVVAVIRNRIRAREAERNNGVLLDDIRNDSDSDDFTHQPSQTFNNGYAQPSFANTMAQPFTYPAPSPVWGGQPLATTPMVLMTQTGEPVVVQVAYM